MPGAKEYLTAAHQVFFGFKYLFLSIRPITDRNWQLLPYEGAESFLI